MTLPFFGDYQVVKLMCISCLVTREVGNTCIFDQFGASRRLFGNYAAMAEYDVVSSLAQVFLSSLVFH